MFFKKHKTYSLIVLACMICSLISYGQPQDTLIKRHQLGVLVGYEVKSLNFSSRISKHNAIGLGYDYILRNNTGFLNPQATFEVNYVEDSKRNGYLQDKDITISAGIRLMIGKGKLSPIIELKPSYLFSVGSDKRNWKNAVACSTCYRPSYGVQSGAGLSYIINKTIRISLKSYLELFSEIDEFYFPGETFTQLKVAYAF